MASWVNEKYPEGLVGGAAAKGNQQENQIEG